MAQGINSSQKDPLLWQPQTKGVWASSQETTAASPLTYRTLMFPAELGQPRYPYYMMFYVNVNSKTELGRQITSTTSASQQVINVQGQSTSGVGQAVGQNASVQVASEKISSKVQEIVSNVSNKAATVVPTFKGINKRLDMAIALPIPASLSYGSGANYDTITSGTLGTLMNAVTNEGLGGAAAVGVKKLLQDAPTALFSGAQSFLNTKAGTNVSEAETFSQIANKLLGIAHNERKEQLFKNVDSRTFNFSWLLIPRTQDESDRVNDVIKWFKWHMHPEIEDKYGLNLLIPNEFDIEFHVNNKEMGGVAKISTCVLESVDVNYTPLGKFVAFEGKDANGNDIPTGNPVAVQLSLRFREIEPLTRTQIGLGY